MASDAFFSHSRRDSLLSRLPSLNQGHRSHQASSSGRSPLTFPPVYLDPTSLHSTEDSANGVNGAAHLLGTGQFILGSTFYHHPQLNALVSNHLSHSTFHAQPSYQNHAFDGIDRDESDSESDAGVAAEMKPLMTLMPKISHEYIALNEDLVPASLDIHGDMLPSEQHPSYPFGNLFGTIDGLVPADSAIVGTNRGGPSGFAGEALAEIGTHLFPGLAKISTLGYHGNGRRCAVPSSWNSSTKHASRTKVIGSGGASAEYESAAVTDQHQHQQEPLSSAAAAVASSSSSGHLTLGGPTNPRAQLWSSAKAMGLSPYLLFRSSTSTVLASPSWPFRRIGPGSTSYAALLRPRSNIYGDGPASHAVAASLGGLPASAKIIDQVWSDLALEELVPRHLGPTSVFQHALPLGQGQEVDQDFQDPNGKKRSRVDFDADADSVFARRIATLESDPLDLLGPISREIRGQAARPWGTFTQQDDDRLDGSAPKRQRRNSRTNNMYDHQSEDESEEARYDADGFGNYDRVRYSFSLPPVRLGREEEEEEEDVEEEEGEPDNVGWETARRIFLEEERALHGGVVVEQVRGIRAHLGVVPRPTWQWSDGPQEQQSATLPPPLSPSSVSSPIESFLELQNELVTTDANSHDLPDAIDEQNENHDPHPSHTTER